MTEPTVSKAALENGKEHLKQGHTVDKHALIAEVRQEHGGKEKLKHTDVPPKSGQSLASEIRAEHGGKERLKKAATVEKQSMLSEVRAERRDGHLHETPKLNAVVLTEVLSERLDGEDPIKIVPVIAEQSIKAGKHKLKEGVKPVEKQNLLSEVRKEHGGADKLKHTETVDKQSLLSEVRKVGSGRHLMDAS
jgi:hypothetical protein